MPNKFRTQTRPWLKIPRRSKSPPASKGNSEVASVETSPVTSPSCRNKGGGGRGGGAHVDEVPVADPAIAENVSIEPSPKRKRERNVRTLAWEAVRKMTLSERLNHSHPEPTEQAPPPLYPHQGGNIDGGDDTESDQKLSFLHGQKAEEPTASREQSGSANQAPRIAFIGVFLNGIAVSLAGFAPAGGDEARALVKQLILEPSSPILPGVCYTAHGTSLAVHLIVDPKNRIFSCVTAEDVPLSVAFSLLQEVQVQYLSKVSSLHFSTRENSFSTRCLGELRSLWTKYERLERTLAHKREARLGKRVEDAEAGGDGPMQGVNVVHLELQADEVAAAAATRLLSPEVSATVRHQMAFSASHKTGLKLVKGVLGRELVEGNLGRKKGATCLLCVLVLKVLMAVVVALEWRRIKQAVTSW